MDYETFQGFFDTLREDKVLELKNYTIKYSKEDSTLGSATLEFVYYCRDGYKIGEDFISECYKVGEIMPQIKTSFDKVDGIRNFDKLIDYLDYLYESNIDRLKEEEKEEEQMMLEVLKEEQLKAEKLNNFLDTE